MYRHFLSTNTLYRLSVNIILFTILTAITDLQFILI